MPAQIDQFVKLKDCILMYSEAAKKSDAEFLRLWRVAFRGFSQMGLNGFWQAKTVSLTVNANKTVSLPNDYINWIRVGQVSGGCITTLKNNQSLFSATSTFAGVADIVGSDVWFSGYVPIGRSTSKSNIEFKIEKNHILLNTGFQGGSILLEYVCSPIKDDDFQIPIQYQEAMIAWLGWQDINYLPATSHIGNGNKQMLLQNFRAQVKLAKKMYKPFRLSEVEGDFQEYNISDTNAEPKPIQPTTPIMFTAHWDYVEGPIADPFTQPLNNVLEFAFGDPISIFLGASPTLNSYIEIRYPVTESSKITYFNTPLNYGTMGDSRFLPVQSNETDRCIVASVPRLEFDITTPTIFS